MRGIAWHLDNVRGKPHHVRRRVAYLAAGSLTAVIALAWLGLSLATGAFALKGSNFAQMTGAEPADATAGVDAGAGTANANTAAVAGADTAAPASSAGPARVEVIPAASAAQDDPSAQNAQNIIPF